MNLRRDATNALWALVLGTITLFCFFAVIGAIDPGDVAWLTVAVGVLAVIAIVHFVRIRHELDTNTRGELARSVNAWRERRGF
jgi:hypothetical protein